MGISPTIFNNFTICTMQKEYMLSILFYGRAFASEVYEIDCERREFGQKEQEFVFSSRKCGMIR